MTNTLNCLHNNDIIEDDTHTQIVKFTYVQDRFNMHKYNRATLLYSLKSCYFKYKGPESEKESGNSCKNS